MDGKPNNAKNYAELLEDMMSVMDYTIDKNENGEYQIFDNDTETYLTNLLYETDTFKSATEIVIRVDATIDERIVDNMKDAVEETLQKLDMDVPDPFPFTAKELDEFIKSNPDVYQELQESGYDCDLEYIDLLANHLNDVNMEQLFSEKWVDDMNIDDDAFFEEDVVDLHVATSETLVSEMIRSSFDWGKEGFNRSFEEMGVEYADLMVQIHEDEPDNPVFIVSLQMYDDSKMYFSNLPDKTDDAMCKVVKPMVVTDDMKTSFEAVFNEHFEGKSVEEIFEAERQSYRDITD